MTIDTFINNGLKRIESDMKTPQLTWLGNNYNCIPSNNNEGLQVMFGGELRTADLILKVRTDNFADAIYPAAQQKIIFDGKTFRIVSVEKDPFKIMLTMVCVSDVKINPMF